MDFVSAPNGFGPWILNVSRCLYLHLVSNFFISFLITSEQIIFFIVKTH